ncbi:hypothetical protein C5167_026911, partial [Papaver somniferum]
MEVDYRGWKSIYWKSATAMLCIRCNMDIALIKNQLTKEATTGWDDFDKAGQDEDNPCQQREVAYSLKVSFHYRNKHLLPDLDWFPNLNKSVVLNL